MTGHGIPLAYGYKKVAPWMNPQKNDYLCTQMHTL